jgi:hypothetical protein
LQNQIETKDFENSVNKILQEFITTKWDDNDPLYDIYCSFDYEDVKRAFEGINNSALVEKPVIHFWLDDQKIEGDLYVSPNSTKGEIVYLMYSVFIVIDEKIEPSIKRKHLLNELSSNLKYKFDNYRINLDMFKNTKIGYSNGTLSKNMDNLYSSHQILTFDVIKEI